jgi:ubiquinone/menaquinone biosynthesis C-methylase UbiE
MSQYDSFATDFSATRTQAWPEFEMIKPYLQKNDRLLDLGCGNGRLRHFLEKSKIPEGNYFGFDLSANLIGIAKNEFPHDHFFIGSFEKKLPFGADNFEVVTAVASFHHLLSKKAQTQFLRECHRVMKPGGTLFLTTWKLPQKHFWTNMLKGNFKNWNIPFGSEKHPRTYRRTNEKELKGLLQKAGFHVTFCSLVRERNYVIIGKKK